MLTLYYSFIYPYLIYCNQIWGSTYVSNTDKLFKLQKRAIRIISNMPWRAHISPLFDHLKILPLHKIYIYKIGTLMFKYSQDLLPSIFDDVFIKNSQIHSYNTRQLFHVPLITRCKRQSTVSYQGPIIGNYFFCLVSMVIS